MLTETKNDVKNEIVLREFAELLLDTVMRDAKRKKRLLKSPNGYYMDDETETYTCFICHRNFNAEDIWLDKYGYKCRDCYNNVIKGVISKTLSKKRNLWCTDWEVTKILNVHPSTREKLIRQEKLKVIELKNSSGSIYERIFMKKENPLLS